MNAQNLIQQLIEQTRQAINQAERLKGQELSHLTWRPAPQSWNTLECLEHLNLYGDFYLPAIEKAMRQSNTQHEATFKPGWLGNYFAESMMPKTQLNKMSTFKDKNPLNAPLNTPVIDKFISQQLKMIELLNQANGVSLNKIKIGTTLSSLIRIKLGDTFRFIINHNIRHLQQITNIQNQM
jgi:hypothetical protein